MVNIRNKGLASYRRTAQNTISRGQRVVMLYDGILKSLKTARLAVDNDSPARFEVIHNEIQRAQQIIRALVAALDFNADAQLAETLQDLYMYWLDRLSEANIQKNGEIIQEVEDLISEMRDTWQKVAAEDLKNS